MDTRRPTALGRTKDLDAATKEVRLAPEEHAQTRQVEEPSHAGALDRLVAADEGPTLREALAKRRLTTAQHLQELHGRPPGVSIMSDDIAAEGERATRAAPRLGTPEDRSDRAPSAKEKRILERDIRDA